MLESGVHFIRGSFSLILAVMLLLIKAGHPGDRVRRRVRRYPVIVAFLNIFIDVFALASLHYGKDAYILTAFATPIVYYGQLFCMTMTTLLILRHPSAVRQNYRWGLIPLVLTSVLLAAGRLASSDGAAYLASDYVGGLAAATRILVYLKITVCVGVTALLTREPIRKELRLFACIYIAYFLLTGVCVAAPYGPLWLGATLLRALVFVSSVIFIFNMKSSPAEDSPAATRPERLSSEPSPAQPDTAGETGYDAGGILEFIRRWESGEDKPYLKEGLTLADVAGQLRITDSQLSIILNATMKINFNTWINTLRIGEAKRLLEDNPQSAISEVAIASGFSDIAVFSRNFKRIEGITASEYKKRCAETSFLM